MERKKDYIEVEIKPDQNQWRLELHVVRGENAYPVKLENNLFKPENDLFDSKEGAKAVATREIWRLKETECTKDDIEKRTVRYQVEL